MDDAPVLEVRSVSKSFGAVVASESISLDLRAGEIHALIGPNGAGKSTLIGQIAGEIRPDAGTIRFGGIDIGHLSAPERARAGLARSFQIAALALELTVLQNVMLAVIGRSQTAFRLFRSVRSQAALQVKARDQLARIGLGGLADMPASALAHGQRRLLEVAIALTLRPKAFLLDEPMAGLGASGTQELTGFLDTLRHEAPILLVEHDMDAVFALADRVSVLVYGRVIATGPVAEIRASRDVREAYLGEDFA